MRQTIPVADIIDEVNRLLAWPTTTHAERKVLCHLMETILHATDNYKGFAWIGADGAPVSLETARAMDPDMDEHSRRRYYVNHKLRRGVSLAPDRA